MKKTLFLFCVWLVVITIVYFLLTGKRQNNITGSKYPMDIRTKLRTVPLQIGPHKRFKPKPYHRPKAEKLRRIDHEIIDWSTLRDTGDPLLNSHQFDYSLNTNVCRDHAPDVLVFVQTSVSHTTLRFNIRHTWGNRTQVGNVTIRTVFFLGQTPNTTLERIIHQEAATYKDIVQGNFIDAYTNLTYKHVMALGWIVRECPTVKLIVKADDDIILNVFNLKYYIWKYGFQANTLRCSIYFYQHPIRTPGEKWYVDWTTYPVELYPKYCEGFGYLMSPDVAKMLYAASESARYYWVDDVFVTGILTLKVGQRLTLFERNHTYVRQISEKNKLKNSLFLSAVRNWNDVWEQIVKDSDK